MAEEKSASPPVVLIQMSVVPELPLMTVKRLSSAVVPVVAVPRPSMATKLTFKVTLGVPVTFTRSTLGAPEMSTLVAAVLPATLTVMVLALVDVRVESMALADKVSMPSPVTKVMVSAELAVMMASSVAVTLTVLAAFAVSVA